MGELAGERCDICGGVLAAQMTDLEFKRDGQRIVVEGVSADVCAQCGEKYVNAHDIVYVSKRDSEGA